MADLSARSPRLRVLVIDKGFSKGTIAKFPSYVDCIIAEVPEPADDLLGGVSACEILIKKEKPDIIAASSRGGRIAAQLRANGCKGPFLLLSAMSTAEAIVLGIHFTIIHGTRDGTNPIGRVRDDVTLGTPGFVRLVELDDEHALRTLSVEQLDEAIKELHSRATRSPPTEPAPAAPKSTPALLRIGLLGQLKARAKQQP